ncbi:MAG: hypothetical protein AAGJ29_11020, partial [Pseudomonadota bacterium]
MRISCNLKSDLQEGFLENDYQTHDEGIQHAFKIENDRRVQPLSRILAGVSPDLVTVLLCPPPRGDA